MIGYEYDGDSRKVMSCILQPRTGILKDQKQRYKSSFSSYHINKSTQNKKSQHNVEHDPQKHMMKTQIKHPISTVKFSSHHYAYLQLPSSVACSPVMS